MYNIYRIMLFDKKHGSITVFIDEKTKKRASAAAKSIFKKLIVGSVIKVKEPSLAEILLADRLYKPPMY